MLKNYFRIAWRSIMKRRFYSLLNITGLSAGIVFTLLIAAYAWSELQINRRLKNPGNQYILLSQWKDPNLGYDLATVGPVAKRLAEDYPNLVANYYRFDGITSVVSKGDKHFREGLQVGDSTLLSMYGFKLLHGDVNTALHEPYSMVIAKDMAIKYFGKTDVVGQTLDIQSFTGSHHDFVVKGVFAETPENSVMVLNRANTNKIFIPVNTLSYFNRLSLDDWGNIYVASYIELRDGVKPGDIAGPIKKLLQENGTDLAKQQLTINPVALPKYYLQKENALAKKMVYALSFIAVFILLMAVVNFINISISSSSSRLKEIGVRKVLGGRKKQLMQQFLTESTILVLIATILAVAAYPVFVPLFEQLVGKTMPALAAFPVYFITFPILLVLFIGFIAGVYPAFVLSSMQSVDSLKGKLKTIGEKVWLRKALAGFQFALAAIVIISAFIVSKQIAHFFGKDIGYNKEYIISAQLPRNWTAEGVQKMITVRNEFAKMPEVANATLSFEIPNGMNGGSPPVFRPGMDSTMAIAMQALVTDEHYVETYQIPMKAGAFFKTNDALDQSKVTLNESAVQALGWKSAEEAIGQVIRIPGTPQDITVGGVVRDFHFGSMQQKIVPQIFFHVGNGLNYRYLSFKVKPGNTAAAIASIEKKWAALLPGAAFQYRFMDDALAELYQNELQLRKASYTATMLSLIIVLLGVLGIVSLSIQKRTKEIGIRKVLGASIPSIISLFLKEFVWVLIVAALVACPLAWVIMSGWLNDYAYRIPITSGPFIIAITGLAVLTAILISLQTLKAGVANPVKSLRTE
jgi:putative ABC transport system permease protein